MHHAAVWLEMDAVSILGIRCPHCQKVFHPPAWRFEGIPPLPRPIVVSKDTPRPDSGYVCYSNGRVHLQTCSYFELDAWLDKHHDAGRETDESSKPTKEVDLELESSEPENSDREPDHKRSKSF